MKTVTVSKFRTQCLELIDEVAATRDSVVITKRGVAIARLVAVEAESLRIQKPRKIFGAMRGSVLWMGDLDSPTGEKWEAEENPDRVLNPPR